MTPEKWKKVKSVLEQVIEIAPDSRADFLDKICFDDLVLRQEVENLLDFDNTKADMLEQNAFSAVMENGKRDFLGKQIGKYKIVGELGTGGMGAVFSAKRADGNFEQQVALKLIKRGMDSDAVLRRFFNERQILASLEHPNIAHLVDGGTTEHNLPFFVMEYVEGETITDYARRENLDLEERLKLFRKVCAAVSFAHSNLVIHRDLKPSNILITKDGTPKLLDFGIAKLLKSDAADATTAAQMQVFTPEYASPEQVKGEKLTTATDVYSLGVILYELLTGNRPCKTDGKNIGDIIKAVCETEPKPPSAAIWDSGFQMSDRKQQTKSVLNRTKNQHQNTKPKSRIRNPKSLKGDLDNIILKALRKESELRYSSVEQFSEDIRRYLDGLPVLARKDTWNYRASKFLRRNQIGVAASSLILITLIAGIGATLYQANVARRESAKAEQRFNDVRHLANSFMFEINDQIVKSPIKARELLVKRALEYLDKLTSEAGNDLELQSELATAYEKIGDIQAEVFKPNLGKSSNALVSHQKALQLRQRLYNAEPTPQRGMDVANSYLRIGDILTMNGRIDETRGNYEKAIEILEPLTLSDATGFTVRRKLASGYARLGQTILRSGSLNEALVNYEKSSQIFQDLQAENPDNLDVQRSVGIVFSFIAFVKMETEKTAEAVEYYKKWLETEKKLVAADKTNVVSRGGLASANTWFGIVLNEQNKEHEAIAYLNEGIKIQEEIFEEDKENFGERLSLADAYLELGKVLVKYERTDEAIKMLEKATAHYQAVFQTDRENLWTKRRIAVSQRYSADAFLQKGNKKRSLEIYQQSLVVAKEIIAVDSNNSEWQHDLAICNLRIGEVLSKTDDKSQAALYFEKALPILEKLSAGSPENVRIYRDLEAARLYAKQFRT